MQELSSTDREKFGEALFKLYTRDANVYGSSLENLTKEQSLDAIWQWVSEEPGSLRPMNVSNKAAGENIVPTQTQAASPTFDDALAAIQRLYRSQPNGSISITLVGETHRNEQDTDRANRLIDEVDNRRLAATYVMIERGLKYQVPFDRERNHERGLLAACRRETGA